MWDFKHHQKKSQALIDYKYVIYPHACCCSQIGTGLWASVYPGGMYTQSGLARCNAHRLRNLSPYF